MRETWVGEKKHVHQASFMVRGRANGGPKATTGPIVFVESSHCIRDKAH